MRRLRLAVFGGVGALLTALAAVLVFAPDLAVEATPVATVVRATAGADPATVALWTTLAVALALAVVAWTPFASGTGAGATESAFERALETPPEAVTADQRRLAAAEMDADLAAAVTDGGEAFDSVRAELARTAAAAYAEYERVDRETGRAAVAAGTWTDDHTAAAFLADGEEPTPTVAARARLWLTPERERRRRVDRVLAAIDRLGEGGG